MAWALAGGFVVDGTLKAVMGLRLGAEDEYNGADRSIHRIGATPEREASGSRRAVRNRRPRPIAGPAVR